MASLKIKLGSKLQMVSVQATGDIKEMKLSALRVALGKTLESSDVFLTADEYEIAANHEPEFTVKDAQGSGDVVNIRRADAVSSGGIKTIQLKKGSDSRSKSVDTSKTLADLRTDLGAWMGAGDHFMAASAPLEVGSEAGKTIESTLSDNVIEIKAAAPGAIAFDVAMGSEENASIRSVTMDTKKMLSDLRAELGTWMSAKDRFLSTGGGEIHAEQSTTIETVLGSAKKILVKKAQGLRPGDNPEVPVVDPIKGIDIGWGLKEAEDVKFDATTYTKLIESLTAKAGNESAAIKWDDLPKGEKQALFRQLQLNHTIRMPAAITGDQDLRCFHKAIVVNSEPLYLNPQNERRDTHSYTFSKQVLQLRQRGVTSAHASFAGFGVAVAANLTHDRETYSRQQQQVMHFEAGAIVEKVRIMIDTVESPGSVQASTVFVTAVNGALARSDAVQQYLELLSALDTFGHYLATEFVIGGKVIRTAEQGVTATTNTEQRSIQFGVEVAADLQTSKGPVKFGGGGGHSNSSNTGADQQQQWANATATVIGGDPAQDYSGWLKSLGSPKRWNVTEYSNLKPTIQFLPDALRQKCVALILMHHNHPDTKKHTFLNMRDYVASLTAKATGDFG